MECTEKMKKAGHNAGLFISYYVAIGDRSGSGNSVYRAGIHTCAAVNAGIGIDSPFLSHFTDGVHRARIITCAAIDAFIGNLVSQSIHLLFVDF
jgi:hypothetical protein